MSEDEFKIGTVSQVTTNGVQVTIDGESAASSKEFKCNARIPFKAGDRVLLASDSGTYVAICALGSSTSLKALNLTKTDMGYTSVTSSNYLTVLNNIVGILKKYNLIT